MKLGTHMPDGERRTITHIHDHSFSWLCTGTSIKIAKVKVVLLAHTSTLREMM
jgi:hypothetical protein